MTTWATVTAAQASLPTGLLVWPADAGNLTLYVDGRLPTSPGPSLTVARGVHLIQVVRTPTVTLQVDVEPDHPVALLPWPAFADDWTQVLASDPTSQAVGKAFAEGEFPDATVWAVDNGKTWQIAPTPKALAQGPQAAAAKRHHLGSALVFGGVTSLGLGALATGVGLAMYLPNQHVTVSTVGDLAPFEAGWLGDGIASAGFVALGLGAAGLVVGIPLSHTGHTTALVAATPTSATVGLRW